MKKNIFHNIQFTRVLFLLLSLFCLQYTYAQNYIDVIFKSHNTTGGIVIQNDKGTYSVHNNEFEVRRKTPPSATYLMLGYLMVAEHFPLFVHKKQLEWDGVHRMFFTDKKTEWEFAVNAVQAFNQQNDYFFQYFLEQIPLDEQIKAHTSVGFPNNHWNLNLPYFWQFGTFYLSPIDQIDFLRKLNNTTLDFSKLNQNQLKNLLFIKEVAGIKLYGTSGYTIFNGEKIVWFVGWINNKNKENYYFSCRLYHNIESDLREPTTQTAKNITLEVFSTLNLI